MNNILLICDDEIFAEKLKTKLIFLRKDDKVVVTNYQNASNDLKCSGAKIVLICDNGTMDLVSELRENKELCLIYLSDNSESILKAADIGVDDFISPFAEDYELVIKIVNNMKHNSIKLEADRNKKLLEQLKVVDEVTGLYCYDYRKQIVENYIDLDLIQKGVFMAFSVSEEDKYRFSQEDIVNALCAVKRAGDIAILGRGMNFYLFMPNTDMNGALIVLNKIKEYLDFAICAGIAEIAGKTFDVFEKEALKALSEAKASQAEFVFAEGKQQTLDEWLDDTQGKSYKLFRQMFNRKLEKVIVPVFYRLQQVYEERLFNTKIEQIVNEERCVFSLINKDFESSLRIVYPGFAKVIIYIEHEGLNRPENKEIELSLSKVSKDEIIDIIEDFIKEFKGELC